MSWWGRIFLRRHLYNDVSEEVGEHIEEKTEQWMRLENLPRIRAREAALRAFGNPSLIEQRSREVWHWPPLLQRKSRTNIYLDSSLESRRQEFFFRFNVY